MKGQDQLPGGQPAADLGPGRAGRHVERWSLAAGGDDGHELAAAVGDLLIVAPSGGIALHLRRLASRRHKAGSERCPQPGHGVEHGGELGMTGQQRSPPRGIGPRQPIRVGAQQTLDRRASATERLGDQPAAADGGLGGSERGIAPTASGRGDPGIEGLRPRCAEPRQRTEGIHGCVMDRRIAEQLRKEQVGLPVGDASEARHQHFHEP